MAHVLLASGDVARALECADRAIRGFRVAPIEDVGNWAHRSTSIGIAMGALSGRREAVEAGAVAAQRLSDPSRLYYFLENGRAGLMGAYLAGESTFLHATIPDGLLRLEERAKKEVADAHARLREVSDGAALDLIRARRESLDDAQSTLERVVQAIQRAKMSEARAAEVGTIAELKAALTSGEVMIEYGYFASETIALVVSAVDARIVRIGKSSDVAAACRALESGDAGRTTDDAIASLRALLVEPLSLGGDTVRVLVSPDGPLAYVPFALLVGERSVTYVPSGTTYGLLRRRDGTAKGDGVLALGDPDYVTHSAPRAIEVFRPRSGERLSPLPGSGLEAKAVGDVVLLGREASEPGLRVAMATRPRWRALHFACHGLLNAARPQNSSLALSPTESDDGFLTVVEVHRTQVPADLVVLSACETAKGSNMDGEGLVGLTRAFLFAGASSVVCSLWKVDDEATKALMVKFYELWNPKDGKPALPTAEALRKAQEFVKSHEKWKHPYYWAAWVLWGLPS